MSLPLCRREQVAPLASSPAGGWARAVRAGLCLACAAALIAVVGLCGPRGDAQAHEELVQYPNLKRRLAQIDVHLGVIKAERNKAQKHAERLAALTRSTEKPQQVSNLESAANKLEQDAAKLISQARLLQDKGRKQASMALKALNFTALYDEHKEQQATKFSKRASALAAQSQALYDKAHVLRAQARGDRAKPTVNYHEVSLETSLVRKLLARYNQRISELEAKKRGILSTLSAAAARQFAHQAAVKAESISAKLDPATGGGNV